MQRRLRQVKPEPSSLLSLLDHHLRAELRTCTLWDAHCLCVEGNKLIFFAKRGLFICISAASPGFANIFFLSPLHCSLVLSTWKSQCFTLLEASVFFVWPLSHLSMAVCFFLVLLAVSLCARGLTHCTSVAAEGLAGTRASAQTQRDD